MNKEEFQKLIGGYATGTLTVEERLKLFEAALEDQELFDALQEEQALKDLFDDPYSRELVERAAAESLPQPKASRASWFRQPWIWASATSLALASVLVVALVRWDRTPPRGVNYAKQVPAEAANQEAQPPPKVEAGKPPADKPAIRAEHRQLARARGSAVAAEPQPSPPAPPGAVSEPRTQGSGQGSGPKESNKNGNLDQLAQNRESDLRDSAKQPAQGRLAETPRKDDQAATPSPAPNFQNQNQIGGTNQRVPSPPPAPPQAQYGQHQQQLRQSEEVQVTAQGPQVTQEKRREMAATTETRVAPARAKSSSNAGLLARKTSATQPLTYLLARKTEDGSFVEVPADTVFRKGDIVRVTVVPGASGPLSISESDAINSQWRQLYPMADSKKMNLEASQKSLVPVDLVVEKDQRLRVTIGSEVFYVSIRMEGAAAK